VANGRIARETPFEKIWIQPAAGDAGGSLGAALLAWYQYLGNPRAAMGDSDCQKGSLLGPQFSDEEIFALLTSKNAVFEVARREEIPARTAALVNGGNVVGWFEGPMEFGPRALGARSILGDARLPNMRQIINEKIKFRERFRPFAPSVLAQRAADYFDCVGDSPYMLMTAPVSSAHRKPIEGAGENIPGLEKLELIRSDIPAVTHVDYSARVQTVTREHHELFYDMLKIMDEKYGCPVVINTSFNVRGEPIVCTPQDAYHCFMRTDMDYLVIGSFILDKSRQPALDPVHKGVELY
jgi:carbamoyltransferase